MTRERQDITEDFYSGNYKEIEVTCYNPDNSPKDLTGSEITYTIFTNQGVVLLRKSTNEGNASVEITDALNGKCVIKMQPKDTNWIYGTFRHHVNIVDENGHEETVLTGKIDIFRAFAFRFRSTEVSAYLVGG